MEMTAFDPLAPEFAERMLMAGCFALAAICSFVARRWLAAGAMLASAAEIIVQTRFAIHDWAQGLFEQAFPRVQHYVIQTWLIEIAGIAGIAIAVPLMRYLARVGAARRVTVTGLVAIAGMAGLELIGRDDLAEIYYASLGPFMLFVWWMAFFALVVAAGSLGETMQRNARD